MDIIGLIPAGGTASRLGKMPCSKEIMPIGIGKDSNHLVVSEHLLSYFQKAGIHNILFIIREGKWDIPTYFKNGKDLKMNIGYLIMDLPYGVPFTLNQAYPFIKDKFVASGFPDIVVFPTDPYTPMIEKIKSSGSDIILGIYPVKTYNKWDMIDFNTDGSIKEICIKQNRPDLRFGWSNIVWSPVFTAFLNNYLIETLSELKEGKISADGQYREPYLGDVIIAAMENGLKVDYVLFENGSSLDLGTPEDLNSYLKSIQ